MIARAPPPSLELNGQGRCVTAFLFFFFLPPNAASVNSRRASPFFPLRQRDSLSPLFLNYIGASLFFAQQIMHTYVPPFSSYGVGSRVFPPLSASRTRLPGLFFFFFLLFTLNKVEITSIFSLMGIQRGGPPPPPPPPSLKRDFAYFTRYSLFFPLFPTGKVVLCQLSLSSELQVHVFSAHCLSPLPPPLLPFLGGARTPPLPFFCLIISLPF